MAVLDLPRTPSAADLALALARRHLRQVYALSGPWRGRTASARPCHPGGSQDPLRPPAGRPGRALDAVGGGYGRHRARARSTVALPLGGRSVRATSTQWRVPRSATGHPPSPPRTLNPSQHALGLVASSGAVRRGAVTEPGSSLGPGSTFFESLYDERQEVEAPRARRRRPVPAAGRKSTHQARDHRLLCSLLATGAGLAVLAGLT
jgi:hypothetical protein